MRLCSLGSRCVFLKFSKLNGSLMGKEETKSYSSIKGNVGWSEVVHIPCCEVFVYRSFWGFFSFCFTLFCFWDKLILNSQCSQGQCGHAPASTHLVLGVWSCATSPCLLPYLLLWVFLYMLLYFPPWCWVLIPRPYCAREHSTAEAELYHPIAGNEEREL